MAEDEPVLMAGVSALAGEGRFRQLYVDHDQPAAVARRWQERLGDLAWVRTRDEAIADGWFGSSTINFWSAGATFWWRCVRTGP